MKTKHSQEFQIGIDIGGTFTDFALADIDNAQLRVHKQLTTTDPLLSICTGLEQLLTKAQVQWSQVSRINHATTLVANAVLERKGDVCALLCTKGFISIFDIGREQRYDQYDLRIEFPKPLIALPMSREINERINSKGEVIRSLSEEEVINTVRQLRQRYQITSLAVCFINSYRNSQHEQRVKEIVNREFPEISISCSADVLPAIREYERWTTTVINAYTQSIFKKYLSEFEGWLIDKGFSGEFYLLGSDGAMLTANIARQYPVRLLASGSAASVLLCEQIAHAYDDSDLLMFDMGGTTTKLGLIREGKAQKRYSIEVARIYQNKRGSGFPVFIPAYDQIEIAGGGCSVASIDERGVLQIGPESMGAMPGPACFNFGGQTPTTVDANLILGFYGTDTLLGGELKTDKDLAEKVIAINLVEKLDSTALRTAWGIYETLNEKILANIRSYSAERGIDYRLCQFVVSGGSAPAHAMAIARKLGITKVIIPPACGVASAVGLLKAKLSFETLQSYRIPLAQLSVDDFIYQFELLDKRVRELLSSDDSDIHEHNISRRLDMRYLGQGFEVEIELPSEDLNETYRSLARLFHQRYESQYNSGFPEQALEIINWKVEVTSSEAKTYGSLFMEEFKDDSAALKKTRKVYSFKTDSQEEWPVYNRYALRPGQSLSGPMLIEDNESTAVFFAEDLVEIDQDLNLIASPA